MNKIVWMIVVCLAVCSLSIAGYCQDDDQSDAGAGDGGSSIEQSEDAMGRGLDSEIRGEAAEAQGEIDQAQETADSHSTAETQVDEVMDSK